MLGMLLERGIARRRVVPGAPTALLQECLAGDEWAVDTVSRDGEHKCVALWRYDKGEANGAPFVNFSDELMAAAGEREESLVRYVFGCLDALGWRWGPCHVEVKLTPDRGPVLVEVNAGRPNGVDFRLICDACIGYNQYDVCADLYLTGGALFDELPTMPPPTLAAAGRLVKLVCAASGVLGGVNFEEAIGALPSRPLRSGAGGGRPHRRDRRPRELRRLRPPRPPGRRRRRARLPRAATAGRGLFS